MAAGVRVHELAREYGVTSKEVLRQLKVLGEFATSSASTVVPPVERRLRERLSEIPAEERREPPSRKSPAVLPIETPAAPHEPPRSITERMNDPFDPLYLPRLKSKPREVHRGPAPRGLVLFLLNEYIVPRRGDDDRMPKSNKYWAREVEEAEGLSRKWGEVLLEGMNYEDILTWAPSGIQTEHALALHRHGVSPHELGWSYEDQGGPNLLTRLGLGTMTVEEVALEAIDRRTRQ